MARDDFTTRIARRLAAWCSLKNFEARPAGSHVPLNETLRVHDMLLYAEDDPEWMKTLSDEEHIATTAEYPRRLLDLARSGRLTDKECRDLVDIC